MNKTRYINLRTDFGFKRIFGSSRHKRLLIRFLNALLGDTMIITDVTHVPNERQSDYVDGKRIVYDVSFVSKVDYVNLSAYRRLVMENSKKSADSKYDPSVSHFILEMQNVYEPPFEDRLVYYACKSLTDQLKKGNKYWLNPVIAIAVTNFNMQHLTPRLVHDMGLRDRIDGEVLTEQLRMFFVSLKEVPEWSMCETELERILFIIKNMDKMDENSDAYKSGEYEEFFEAADSQSLAAEEAAKYATSLAHLEDVEASVNFASMIAREEGLKQGMKQGIEKGHREGVITEKQNTAERLLNMNLSVEMIAAATGLSIEEICNIKNRNN